MLRGKKKPYKKDYVLYNSTHKIVKISDLNTIAESKTVFRDGKKNQGFVFILNKRNEKCGGYSCLDCSGGHHIYQWKS